MCSRTWHASSARGCRMSKRRSSRKAAPIITTTMDKLARLLQLASPTLPVGAYSYSQGLEAAVEASIVGDAASAERWIADVLELSVARMELAVLRQQLSRPT